MNPSRLASRSTNPGYRIASRFRLPSATLAMALIAKATFAATPISTCGYLITVPGSYTLTADLTCPGVGIMVASSDVDLDLNSHLLASSASQTDVGIITANQDPLIPSSGQLDFSSCLTVTAVHIHGGTVTNFNQGIVICSNNASTNGPSVTMAAQIDHMVISSNHVGIALLSSGMNTINTNFLSLNDTYAMQLENAATNMIGKNLVDSNNIGISINNSSDQNTVSDNSVTLSFYIGVRVTDSTGNTVSNNFFTDSNNASNAVGIAFSVGSSGNSASGNIAFYSGIADLIDLMPCGSNSSWTNDFFGSSIGCSIQ